TLATHQAFGHTAPNHRLEHLAQQVGITEAAVARLRKGRVVRNLAVEAETTEPAIGEVQVHLIAQPPLRADAKTVADDQHANQQLRIDRRPSYLAVEWGQVRPDLIELQQTGQSLAEDAFP